MKRNILLTDQFMTIIVGIICKDGIVLASDSQTSQTSSTSKRCDARKFALVELVGAKVLVAQAGSVTTSSRVIEIMRDLARAQGLMDYRTVADLAQRAMRQMKDELRSQQCDCSMEELRDFIWRNDIGCELMIAHYFDGKPHIFTVDLVVGIPTKVNSHYVAIGCGSNLGEYLLSEHSRPDTDLKFGSAVAVYVVEKVKKHDAFCGGPTRIAVIPSAEDEEIAVFGAEEVESFAAEIEELDLRTKEERNQRISDQLESLADRWRKRLFNELLS